MQPALGMCPPDSQTHVTPGVPPQFTQCGGLSGIGRMKLLPVEIQVCLCSPDSLSSPYPGLLHLRQAPSPSPCQFKSNPNAINASVLCRTNRRALSLRTSILQTLGHPVSLRASQQSHCPPQLHCPPPSITPWGGTGRSVWPLHFLGWACWGLETLTLPCSANYATLVTGFVT